MAATRTATVVKPQSKLCIRCNKVLPIGSFYANKNWAEQQYHDTWCKDCAAKYVKDKEGLIQYCHDNNRAWHEMYWEICERKAMLKLANNADYISPRSTS